MGQFRQYHRGHSINDTVYEVGLQNKTKNDMGNTGKSDQKEGDFAS